MTTTETVRLFIEQHQLLHRGQRHLVAVSGGADSVCLLLMLRQLGYDIEAVHCNFHLRGEESDRDEMFVKRLCREQDIALHLTHFDTATYASLHHVSIEMAARNLRYRYFEQLRQDIAAGDICVAHHRDDVVETVLMNLVRGTGLRGLQGIQPRRGHIVRPLLCIGRADIEAWLREQGQTFVTDSSNLTPDIVRNHLRLNVIPQLQQMVPSAVEGILTTARRVGEALRVYSAATANALQRIADKDGNVDIGLLLQEPSPESLLYEWLSPCGFNGSVIEDISMRLRQEATGRLWSSATHDVCLHRGRLLLRPHRADRPTLRVPEPGTYVYDDDTRFCIKATDGATVSRLKDVATLDADSIVFPLMVRRVQAGDRFTPYGMKGSKLISDYLTDRHVSLIDKRSQLVVADATGRIAWLVGERTAAFCAISGSTRRTLTVSRLTTSGEERQ